MRFEFSFAFIEKYLTYLGDLLTTALIYNDADN